MFTRKDIKIGDVVTLADGLIGKVSNEDDLFDVQHNKYYKIVKVVRDTEVIYEKAYKKY